MPIIKKKDWEKWVKNNKDPYGKACVDVARVAMALLDETEEFDCHKLLCEADDKSGCGGMTGFMSGCVAQMISHCHSRGEEFRVKWNVDHAGEEARGKKGVVNPAIVTLETKEQK